MNTINAILTITIFYYLLDVFVVCSDSNWSYADRNTNPSTWSKTYPKCGGKRQSPINIDTKTASFDGSFSDLNIHYSLRLSLNLTNNGRAITAKLPTNNKLNFTGAGLKSTYVLDRFHFHVGSDSSKGSEHQTDGRKYPMELQLVHYDVNKSSDITAAIMSVLVTQGTRNNNHFDKLISSLQNCSYKDDSTKVSNFSVKDILPNDIEAFYRYSGSFTTPACNENVEWIIFHQTVSISSAQLQKFRSVFSGSKQETKPSSPLVNNFRPIQALNNRIVLKNFDHLKFICGKKNNFSADCRTTVDGHDVFYEVEVKPCTLPVSVIIKINVPGLGFNVQKTLTEDQRSPIVISNLKYGSSVEFHFHAEGPQRGKLHVTVHQFPLSQVTNMSKVIDEDFQVEGICKRGNCTVQDKWDTHWCTSTFGIQKPLLIGFTSKLSPCQSPSVSVEVYRSEFMKQSWVLTAKQEFRDKQTHLVNLTSSLVGGKDLRMRKAISRTSNDFTAVYLQAYVKRISGGKINFDVFLLVKKNGGHYLVFSTQYKYPSLYCSNKKPDGHGKKVAIGVIIVVILVLIIGVAAFLLYRNRRNYFGHRPALVDEIEVQDADRL